MRVGGNLAAFRFVHFALAVVGPKATAYPLLVAMPSIATSQTGPLVSVLSLPKPVIVLDATSNSNNNNNKLSVM